MRVMYNREVSPKEIQELLPKEGGRDAQKAIWMGSTTHDYSMLIIVKSYNNGLYLFNAILHSWNINSALGRMVLITTLFYR